MESATTTQPGRLCYIRRPVADSYITQAGRLSYFGDALHLTQPGRLCYIIRRPEVDYYITQARRLSYFGDAPHLTQPGRLCYIRRPEVGSHIAVRATDE
jgi:hypothetical protein